MRPIKKSKENGEKVKEAGSNDKKKRTVLGRGATEQGKRHQNASPKERSKSFSASYHDTPNGSANYSYGKQSSAKVGYAKAMNDNNFATPRSGFKRQANSVSATESFQFSEHLSVQEAERLLHKGELIYGVLRVSTAQYREAYVPSTSNDSDVLIFEIANRNRAFSGDCVAVRVEPVKNWRILRIPGDIRALFKSNSVNKKEDRDWFTVGEVENVHEEGHDFVRNLLGVTEEVNLWDLLERNSLASMDHEKLQRTGKVVCLLNPVAPRVAVGYLRIPDMYRNNFASTLSLSNETAEIDFSNVDAGAYAILSPTNIRTPRLCINMRRLFETHARDSFARLKVATKERNWDNVLFYAEVTEWPIDSKMPFGAVVRALGPVDDVAVRNAAILLENGVDYEEQFDETIQASLSKFFGKSNAVVSTVSAAANTNARKNECTKPKAKTNVVLQQFHPPPSADCTEAVNSASEAELEVRISEEESQARRDFDFRNELSLCTIDPETARDLDDAVHCRQLPSDSEASKLFEVGVHIADVSHFVEKNSALDEEAKRRATTVYLAERAIHMLPDQLSQQLASLAPGHDRLTFSVVWQLCVKDAADGEQTVEIVSERFGKSMINSCAQLSYEDAQSLLSDETTNERLEKVTSKLKHGDLQSLKRSLRHLNTITRGLHTKRQRDGALRIENPKLQFRMDSTGMPSECVVYARLDSHRLIEELMLLANTSVAQTLFRQVPGRAFLRRHPKPTMRQLANLASQCAQFGFPVGSSIFAESSSADLQRALNGLESTLRSNACDSGAAKTSSDDQSAIFRIFLNVCSKVLPLAAYYCEGYQMDGIWSSDHYALAMQHYCHFTSPIRRFADIVVHRQLAEILDNQNKVQQMSKPNLNWHNEQAETIVQLQRQAELCNQRKRAARDVQESQTTLYLGVFIKNLSPVTDQKCYVIAVFDHSIDLYVTRFGLIKRCYKDKQDGLLKWQLKPVCLAEDANQSSANAGDGSLAKQVENISLRDRDASCSESLSETESEEDDECHELNATVSEPSKTPMELVLTWKSNECIVHRNAKTADSNSKASKTGKSEAAAAQSESETCKCKQQKIRLLQPIKCSFVNLASLTSKSKLKKQRQGKSSSGEKACDPFDWVIKIERPV